MTCGRVRGHPIASLVGQQLSYNSLNKYLRLVLHAPTGTSEYLGILYSQYFKVPELYSTRKAVR